MTYEVAVRALCEFTAKQGDLDLRFTPSPSALEGIAGHALIASRRGEGYETEIRLDGEYGALRVRGRADGYDPQRNQLEEFKTYRGDLDRMPANHRAPALGAGEDLRLADVPVEEPRADPAGARVFRRARASARRCSSKSIRRSRCGSISKLSARASCNGRKRELAHRDARDASLSTLSFPHAAFHEGQRKLAEGVYRAVKSGRCLMAQAPTGIGKTIGTIFPVLKAMPAERIDKLFFLVAKTSGRRLALDSLARLREREPDSAAARARARGPRQGLRVPAERLLRRLRARWRKASTTACPRRAEEAASQNNLDQKTVREIALRHQVCPYYLSQETGEVVRRGRGRLQLLLRLRARCSTRSRSSTTGASCCSRTSPTTSSSAAGRCTPLRSRAMS